MTPDEENALVSMARPLGATNASRDAIRLAIRAAVAQERERAAKVCEGLAQVCLNCQKGDAGELSNVMLRHHAAQATDCAAAIRRGE